MGILMRNVSKNSGLIYKISFIFEKMEICKNHKISKSFWKKDTSTIKFLLALDLIDY